MGDVTFYGLRKFQAQSIRRRRSGDIDKNGYLFTSPNPLDIIQYILDMGWDVERDRLGIFEVHETITERRLSSFMVENLREKRDVIYGERLNKNAKAPIPVDIDEEGNPDVEEFDEYEESEEEEEEPRLVYSPPPDFGQAVASEPRVQEYRIGAWNRRWNRHEHRWEDI